MKRTEWKRLVSEEFGISKNQAKQAVNVMYKQIELMKSKEKNKETTKEIKWEDNILY